jgi:hypothetical protein
MFQRLGSRVYGFRGKDLGFKVQGSRFGFRV